MEWWRWAAAGTYTLLVLVLLALRLDTVRDRVGWTSARALRSLLPWAGVIPAGVLVIAFSPWWVELILIAIPALAIAAMALAS